jgi:hypothetical protein
MGASYAPALVVDSDLLESQKPFLIKYWGQFFVAKYAGWKLTEGGSITLTSASALAREIFGLGHPIPRYY